MSSGRSSTIVLSLLLLAAASTKVDSAAVAAKMPLPNVDLPVKAALVASGKKFASYADRRTLFRRLTFDLTGLPPTPAETAAFLADKSPQAWTKIVDRLLASPAFGERWAAHWLDGVGYADVFRQGEKERALPEAWRYRDWVVRAFNTDVPYQQFIARQLAGDVEPMLAASWDPANVVATGFLSTGIRAGAEEPARQQARLVAETLLGLKADASGKVSGLTGEDEAGLLGIFRAVRAFDTAADGGAPSLVRLPLLNDAHAKAREERITRETSLADRVRSIGETLRREYATRMQAETARYLLAVWDYQRRPEGDAGLSPAAFAAKQGLNPYAFQRWQELSVAQDYALLTKSAAGVGGNPKVFSWRGEGDNPSAVINTTDEELQIATFRLVPRSVSVHPSPTGGVGVAWKSPVAGIVKLSGYVQDADAACGNGVAWRLARQTAAGETVLAKGEIDNGGGAKFGVEGLRIETYVGETLLLAIEPKQEYSCDTTTVDLKLSTEDGKTVWSLSQDLVKEPLAGNPHADSAGRGGVWSYVDLLRKAPRPAPSGVPAASLIAWRAALAQPGSERAVIEKAAQSFQAQFNLAGPESPFWIASVDEEQFLPRAERVAYQGMAAELAELRRNPLPEVQYAHGVREILGMGDSSPRGVPRSLGGPSPVAITSGSGRVELAHWLASPEQARPSRTWVNRVRGKLFVAPLSDTPGEKGAGPSEILLAKLSDSFRTDMGGSTKALVRLLVHSRAYHQASTPVAGVPRWTQQSPRRLSTPEMMDFALAAVERLDTSAGKSVQARPEHDRLSLYLAQYRSETDGKPLLEGDERRLDGVALIVAKRVLATSAPDGRSRIRRVYRLLLDRSPTAAESADGLRRLGDAALRSGGKSEVAWTEYTAHLLRSPEVRRVR